MGTRVRILTNVQKEAPGVNRSVRIVTLETQVRISDFAGLLSCRLKLSIPRKLPSWGSSRFWSPVPAGF